MHFSDYYRAGEAIGEEGDRGGEKPREKREKKDVA